MKRVAPGSLGAPDIDARALWLAPTTIVIGSLMTALPFIAVMPVLPPFGLMLLIAWRMRRPDAFRSWAPVPLGLIDDLVSGQPLGSAMLLWTLAFLALDVIDTRLFYRDFWQDWVIGTATVAACLIVGRLFAVSIGAHVDAALLVQVLVSGALFPLVVRLVAALDPRHDPE